MYLLDSSTCVDIMRGKPSQVLQRFYALSPAEMAICIVVRAELLVDIEMKQDPTAQQKYLKILNRFCQQFYSFPLDEGAVRFFARIYAYLKQQKPSQLIGDRDMLIAAIAQANDLTLVTSNEKHFSRVPLLRWKNWRTGAHAA